MYKKLPLILLKRKCTKYQRELQTSYENNDDCFCSFVEKY